MSLDPPTRPPELARLLAGRDQLSRIEKEHIFAQVIAEVAPARRTRWWMAAVPALAAAAIVVLVIVAQRPTHGEFTARGGGGSVASLAITCSGASGACARGDKLLFDIHGTTGYRYLAAFAQRDDGTVLWYFPADAGTSLDLAGQPADGVLDRGIVLGAEHPAGTYRVYAVFSRRPLTREQLRARFDPAQRTAGPGTAVVVRELTIR